MLDIGAGTGRLTRELARAGARVEAIELDPLHAEALRRTLAAPNLVVVEGDAAIVRLPREPFRVVANLPFGRTTAILRRLLDPRVPLTRADVVVEWDVARKRSACWPSTVLGVCWGAWFDVAVVRRLPRGCFEPPPSVDAALLRITRRRPPLVAVEDHAAFCAFVRQGFARGLPATQSAKHALRAVGARPATPPRELDVHQWAALYAAVRRSGYSAAAT